MAISIKGWQKEFNNRFGNRFTYPCKEVYPDFPERVASIASDLKDFIQELLSSERKRWMKEVRNKLPKTINPNKLEGSYGAGMEYELGRHDYRVLVKNLLNLK